MTARTFPPDKTALGITLTLTAVAGFALLDSTVKYLSAAVPLLVVVWVRYVVQAGVMGVVVKLFWTAR